MAALTQDVLSRMPLRRNLTPEVVVWAFIALAAASFWPTLAALARVWTETADYQHGFLIALICLLWIARCRHNISAAPIRGAPAAMAALVTAVGVWLIAYRANSELMQQLMFPLVLLCALLAALGPSAMRAVAAPIAYFYFAIPIWDQLIPLLQWLATYVAEGALGALGIPTHVEGHIVTIPAGTFSIDEGCSGSRYFIAGLAFAALLAAAQNIRGRRMILLLAAAIIGALVTNWLRVIMVIYAGHVTDMQHYWVATEHNSLGYLMFVPLLLLIGLLAKRLACFTRRELPDHSIAPRVNWLAPAIVLVVPALAWMVPQTTVQRLPTLGPLPLLTGTWQGPLPPTDEWRPVFVEPSDELRASYRAGAHVIDVYVNTYGRQVPGRELVFHANSIAPADHWTRVRRVPTAREMPTLTIVANPQGVRWVVGQTYVVGGQLTARPALAQMYYGFRALWHPVPSGAAAIATPCATDCDAAAQRLQQFWAEQGSALISLIPSTL